MKRGYWLEVISRDGWAKRYPLERKLTYVGSDPRSDILLENSPGAADTAGQVQLVANRSGYTLINLSEQNLLLRKTGQSSLLPQAMVSLVVGAGFNLGQFTLVLRQESDPQIDTIATTENEQLRLSLNLFKHELAPQQSLHGYVTVCNLGEKSGVKIDLELEGLTPECYHLESGPILSSGAEENVQLRIYHHGNQPPAGSTLIRVRAMAPRAYPQSPAVTVSQPREVRPFYDLTRTLRDPDADDLPPGPRPPEGAGGKVE
jgi:hypothetical protein